MSASERPSFAISPVVLEGTHVRLEPMSREHLNALFAVGQDEEVFRWMSVWPRTRDDFARWIDTALAAQSSGTELPFVTVDRATSGVVGSTRYLNISPRDRRLEIGWTWLTPAAQRTRINTEAKLLQLTHCFETLGCVRVEWKTDARNEKSRNAILRLGAVQEGILRKQMFTQHGIYRDNVWFGMLDDEWPAAKARLQAKLAIS